MPTISEYIDSTLESSYKKIVTPVLNQVHLITNSPKSRMQVSLQKLDDEARRLDESEERMFPDNPQFEQTLDIYKQSLDSTSSGISAISDSIELLAATVALRAIILKIFTGLATGIISTGKDPMSPSSFNIITSQLQTKNIPWVVPDAADIAAGYVNTKAWIDRMDGWGVGYANRTKDTLVNGLKQGWSPTYTARQMRHHAENIPKYAAENLTRTLQLTSYRDAVLGVENLNSSFIIKKIRIATLRPETCLCCIALHGTELAPGQRVDDHYSGKCDVFYVVPGGPEFPEYMQSDSLPGQRNFVPYQNGEDWFNSLPESRQRQQVSFARTPAKWNAYKDGHLLSEFVGEHHDDVFGRQVIENSLKNTLGQELAEAYYVR